MTSTTVAPRIAKSAGRVFAHAAENSKQTAATWRRMVCATVPDIDRLLLVRCWPVQLWNRHIEQSQVNRQLAAMMHKMVDGVTQRIFSPGSIVDVRAGADVPRSIEIRVTGRR